jgi:hypothetical protein
MASGGNADYRARRRERERQRRQRSEREEGMDVPTPPGGSTPVAADGRARRAAASSCAWCGGVITPRSRGPIPKWCSTTCRHRAWEQMRAAASGRSAVQVVERRVEISTPIAPTRRDWGPLLTELARQLEDGRVYDRDLVALAEALNAVLDAYSRRRYVRDRSRAGSLPHLWSAPGPVQLSSTRATWRCLDTERRPQSPVVLQWRRHRKDRSGSDEGRQMSVVRRWQCRRTGAFAPLSSKGPAHRPPRRR